MSKSRRKKRKEQTGEPEQAGLVEIDFKGEGPIEALPSVETEAETEAETEIETSAATKAQAECDELAASKAWRLALSLDELNAIMQRGEFGPLRLVPWGSNYTFLTTLCDGPSGAEYAVIYKPRRGEAPLWDFPNGTLYKREYAAYIVSEALGWHFIPPVIIRDGPHGPGTVQIFIDANENIEYYQFRDRHEHELKRFAVFDQITNNADRKAGHCLLGMDNFVWGIDHGLCFNSVPKLRTIIWEFSGQPLPKDIYQDLAELATNPLRSGQLRARLEELLDQREVEIFFSRLEQILQKPLFPGLSSRRQVPWGF